MSKDHRYNLFVTRLVKKDGKLSYHKKAFEALFLEFVKSLGEGQRIDVSFEANDGSGTYDQKKKIHACIREISMEMGDTFKESKKMIKKLSGLYFEDVNRRTGEITVYEKSFTDCSVQELGLVIQAIIQAGDDLGINFRGQFPLYSENPGLDFSEDQSF